ncbi:nuclear transport factor 2 family protein [Chondromyces apiculatus]|uniref:SnoaL-like domain-containing protein n=1 Tax=Chondromyces apiculatus DSM 436 TaxID=1192034 RepID=A0A017SWT6_9BACT|nr:nuclear transport factor 2 family protein [Chondromyces apiculatus]EYF01429.1 Hypothetical protein CAP_8360 [Chondromyces apiculatus DSM 436]
MTLFNRLDDAEEIRQLKAKYAVRADAVFRTPGNASAVALGELFTEDGILDLGPFGRYEGKPALLNAFENILPLGTAWSIHLIVNGIIDVNALTATGNWTFLIFAQANTTPYGPEAPIYGGYNDQYRKVGGHWKIAESISFFTQPRT